MAVDASIPLSALQFRIPSPAEQLQERGLINQAAMGQIQLKEAVQQYQDDQKIRALSQQSGSMDPQTGFWTPQGLQQLASISPPAAQKAAQQRQAGLLQLSQIRQANVQEQVNLGLIDKRESEMRTAASQELNEVWLNRYDAAKKAGANEQEATRQAEEGFQEEFSTLEKGGRLPFLKQGEKEAILGQKRDADSVRAKIPREQLQKEKEQERKAGEPLSAVGKIEADYKSGRISKSQRDEAIKKAEGLQINLGPAISEGGLASAAAQAATGEPLTQVVPGYGNAAAVKREQVREAAVKQIMAENPGMSERDAGVELASRATGYIAGRRSVGQLTTMLGATKQAVSQLEFNINKTKEALQSMPGSNLSPVINAIVRGEQRWTGDPRYSQLFYFMHATAMESARILQGGQASIAQLHQGAADEAKKWADANLTTPKAFIEGAAPAMIDEGRYRIKSFEDAIRSQSPLGGAMPPPPGPAQEGRPGAGGRAFDPSILPPDKQKQYQENARQLEEIRRKLGPPSSSGRGELPGGATYEPAQ